MKKGFTLIELLVVISIIGLLSAVVLASLKTAKDKGNDAKIKGQVTSMRSAAEIYLTTSGNYGSGTGPGNNVCNVANTDTTGLYKLEQASAYPDAAAPGCITDSTGVAVVATQWAAWHVLSDGSYWCADSTGKSKSISAGTWVAPTTANPKCQ